MRITNLNPRSDIGASAWHVEIDGNGLLMDAGIHPKEVGSASLPLFGEIRDRPVDAIAITHCHHDHVGALPVAAEHFPEARILMSDLSRVLVERVLHNSVNVMEMQREESGIEEYPFYRHRQLNSLCPTFGSLPYNRSVSWGSRRRKGSAPSLEFFDAGHSFGSAGILVRGGRQSVFYTGDVSFRDQTLLRGARFRGIKADVLILETTRGNREVDPGFSREKEIERLIGALRQVLDQGGSVLIPVFALGRTQEILSLLAMAMEEGRLRRQPVYIGGLGRVFTQIYDSYADRVPRNHPGLKLMESLRLVVMDRQKVDRIQLRRRRLFVLTAGMMSENTPAHEIGARMIEEEDHAIFFVGYAAPETPAGRLRAAAPGSVFDFSSAAGSLSRRCNLQEFDLTAHANREELMDFVGQISPRTVVLAHGEEDSQQWFAEQIRDRHPGIRVLRPGPGQSEDV